MRLLTLVRGAAAACLALFPVSVGHAENPADFYKGKNVDLYIGYSAGGGYDLYARSLARHKGRLIAGNPAIVPKNKRSIGSPTKSARSYLSRAPRQLQGGWRKPLILLACNCVTPCDTGLIVATLIDERALIGRAGIDAASCLLVDD